ncbi:MAG: protein-(glutamine-N5) methyltransferase, release factor-specific [Candidatus Solincola sediminis]|uniref:Release factor glutamine methyltransferase n=1 Tax=Candidatus Solincola sediminis TaxID=1797199 RepID=A0A1F2WFF3_9ACTN|nr:MAG: protein-(glutamine-N5) methyltransferase, release factor-specific [Candidatus Solincola sediminis]OFW57880.1 MAG: protein-(glutamine-N5) methyltransferase, release factor-specific [Candidatus Solincola sediminis]
MRNIPGLIKWATAYLEQNQVIKPRLNAEQLLSHCTGRSRVDLYAYPEWPVTKEISEAFERVVMRRAGHEPLQYITGIKWFRYLELAVDPRVLIPRPETEMLVEKAIETIAKMPGHPLVADIGTGSGCIALSIAKECPAAVVHATDRHKAALEVAKANAERSGLSEIILFHAGDLLDAVPRDLLGKFQAIVSNPPYVSEPEFLSLPSEVREHEPRHSLVSGPSGTEIQLRLMEEAPGWLDEGGWLLIEGGEHQVVELAERAITLGYAHAEVIQDLNAVPRILKMQAA